MLVASSTQARQTRQRDSANGTGFWRTTLIGMDAGVRGLACLPDVASPESAALYPVAYMIELDPHAVLGTHFHRANQFQIFVDGDGSLGQHALERVFVHYADAYTGYGPLCAGAHGLHFFTLRDAWDPGARFLPDGMAELRAGRRGKPRQEYAGPIAVGTAAHPLGTPTPQSVSILEFPDNGVAAWLHRLPPGAAVAGANPRGTGGQHWLVLAGSLSCGAGEVLPALSCVFVTSDEPALAGNAGPEGCEVLCLQFPTRAAAVGA